MLTQSLSKIHTFKPPPHTCHPNNLSTNNENWRKKIVKKLIVCQSFKFLAIQFYYSVSGRWLLGQFKQCL